MTVQELLDVLRSYTEDAVRDYEEMALQEIKDGDIIETIRAAYYHGIQKGWKETLDFIEWYIAENEE